MGTGLIFSGFIEIIPVPKGRPRFTRRGHTYTPQKTVLYEKQLRAWFKSKAPELSLKPIIVNIEFVIPKPKSVKRVLPTAKPDLDNLVKAALDAGNGIIWKDDAQIISTRATKLYAAENSPVGLSLVVSELQ